MDKREKKRLARETVARIRESCGESNRRVARRHFGRDELFAEGPDDGRGNEAYRRDDFAEIFEALLERKPKKAKRIAKILGAGDAGGVARRVEAILDTPAGLTAR